MKRIRNHFWVALGVCLLFSGCDKEENTALITNLLFEEPVIPDVDPTNFDALNTELIVLLETFNTNNRNWSSGNNSNYEAQVNNGFYYFFNKTPNSQYNVWNDFEIEDWQDFQLTARIKAVENPGDESYRGLLMGDSEDKQHLNFLYSHLGNFSVTYNKEGQRVDLQDWVDSPISFSPDDWVELTVRMFQGQYYFFINRQYVGFATPFITGLNGRIGFSVGSSSGFQADLISVSYLGR